MKGYVAPDMEILLLEQTDIITTSMPGGGAENSLPDDDFNRTTGAFGTEWN